MLLQKHDDFLDLASILALHSDYCSAEEFINGDYDVRIQKIGNNYRAYRRKCASGWKGNQGTAILDDIEMTERYKLWADECSKLFGGMDILAIDAIHCQDSEKEYILEVNDCSIGLGPLHEEEDLQNLVDLTLQRMCECFSKSNKSSKKDDLQSTPLSMMDSSGSLQKLEVDLINTENAKKELEIRFKDLQKQTLQLAESNKKLRSNNRANIAGVLGAGLMTGLTAGALITFVVLKYVKRYQGFFASQLSKYFLNSLNNCFRGFFIIDTTWCYSFDYFRFRIYNSYC